MEDKDIKVDLEYQEPDKIIITHRGVKIELIPFLEFSEQIFLINNYLEVYFGTQEFLPNEEVLLAKPKHHIFEAEEKLMLSIIILNTNINIESCKNDVFADSVLWDMITQKISNWWMFRERLNATLEEVKREEEMENSIGSVLTDLIENLNNAIDKLTDISPEEIENLQKTGLEMVQRLEESSVMRNPSDLPKLQ